MNIERGPMNFEPNPEMESEINRRRHISESMLEKHGAFRDENGVLQPTHSQIERMKQEGESYLDQQMWSIYEMVKVSIVSKVKSEATGPLSVEDEEALQNMSKKEKIAFIGKRMAEEKRRFMEGEISNPKFSYIELEEVDYDQIRANLDDAKIWFKRIVPQTEQKESLQSWYLEKINQLIVGIEKKRSAKEGNDEKLTRYAKLSHGEPGDEVEQACWDEIKAFLATEIDEVKEGEKIEAEEIANYFRAAILAYNFEFGVSVVEGRDTIAVSYTSNEVKVPTNREVFFSKLQKLVAHEIETHVLRKMSSRDHKAKGKEFGKKGRLKLLKEDTMPGYIETEEGLAIYNQQVITGRKPSEPDDLTYVIRTLGICLAKERNFRDTYEELIEVIQPIFEHGDASDPELEAQEMAWVTCLRIFRGISDTSKAGNYDPYMWRYMKGNLAVWDFVDSGGDIAKLYIGKIGIDHIQDLYEMGITEPATEPRFIAREMHRLSDVIKNHKDEWDQKSDDEK